jgi:hypothetical protein
LGNESMGQLAYNDIKCIEGRGVIHLEILKSQFINCSSPLSSVEFSSI